MSKCRYYAICKSYDPKLTACNRKEENYWCAQYQTFEQEDVLKMKKEELKEFLRISIDEFYCGGMEPSAYDYVYDDFSDELSTSQIGYLIDTHGTFIESAAKLLEEFREALIKVYLHGLEVKR